VLVEDFVKARRLLPVIVALAAIVGTAACSGPSNGPAPAPSSSAAQVPGALPGDQVESAVRTAFQNATAVHIHGTLSNQNGSLTLDLQLNRNDTAAGTVNEGGATMPLRAVDGTYYLQFTPQLVSASTNPQVKQAAARLTGKWVTGTSSLASGIVDSLKGLLSYNGFLRNMFSQQSQVPKATTTDTVAGVPVVVYEAGDGASVSVATASPHYLMRMTAPSDGSGQLDFTDWNKPVPVSAPAASDIYRG
jgi:hypothetical protein